MYGIFIVYTLILSYRRNIIVFLNGFVFVFSPVFFMNVVGGEQRLALMSSLMSVRCSSIGKRNFCLAKTHFLGPWSREVWLCFPAARP